jgi:hypothetical protein
VVWAILSPHRRDFESRMAGDVLVLACNCSCILLLTLELKYAKMHLSS